MKTNLHRVLIVAVILFNSMVSLGQSKYVTMGDKAFQNLQYYTAIKHYSKALSNFEGETSIKNDITFQLANCYRMVNKPERAEIYYEKLIKNKYSDNKPEVLLYYALALNSLGQYKEAQPVFDDYLEIKRTDPLAIAGKASCELALKDSLPDSRWVVKNIKELNSANDDFAALYADSSHGTILFSSNRKGTTGKDVDNWTNGQFSDLFLSKKKNIETWGPPELADKEGIINTEANEGAAGFNSNYTRLYFTRCAKADQGTLYCQIYEVRRVDGSWKDPMVLFTESQGNVGQPTLSPDGLTMVFSSNKPGGKGGKDLYKTTRSSLVKPFRPAQSLGPQINTPGDELFPVFASDSIIYYSSNGRPGFGGLDIYRANISKTGKIEVVHMPRPINSFADDFSMTFKDVGVERSGFLTSRREGGKGGDDIYSFDKIPPVISIKGSVIDEVTLQPIPRLKFGLSEGNQDTLTFETDVNGAFLITGNNVKELKKYTLTFTKENYFTKKSQVAIGLHEFSTTYVVNVALQPIPDKPIVLPDIYYELDKWDLLPQYQDSLLTFVTILNDNPKITIELGSHTDSRASTKYNDDLSQKRAESVVNFLTEKGIEKSRLIAKGYGERVPRTLTKDFNLNGLKIKAGTSLTEEFILTITDLKDREAAYQLNRRTEFKVIKKKTK